MGKFRDIFPRKNTLFIVVHAEDHDQVLRNATIAKNEGADGIFLINHRISRILLAQCYCEVRERYPDWWIGVNFLGLGNRRAIEFAASHKVSGLWLDNVGIEEDAEDPSMETRKLGQWRIKYKASDMMLFGGVAFKYQRPVRDPAYAAKVTSPFIDVVTTSGEGTGMAADIRKIRSMKQAIGDHPLAIASGITPQNVRQYMPYADCFLVATGVSHSYIDLDPALVGKLVKRIDSNAFVG